MHLFFSTKQIYFVTYTNVNTHKYRRIDRYPRLHAYTQMHIEKKKKKNKNVPLNTFHQLVSACAIFGIFETSCYF